MAKFIKKKVFIGVPTHRTVQIATLVALQQTIATSQHSLSYYFRVGDGLISRARNEIGRQVLQEFNNTKWDYLMFIDDDIIWDPKMMPIDKLIADDKDIICGVYSIRDETLRPAIRTKKMQRLIEQKKYEHQKITVPKGISEIEFAAGGFMLIKKECLLKVYQYSSHPFTCAVDKNNEYLSEDYAFCYRAKHLGYTIWTDSSIKLGHIGECVYYLDGIKTLTH